MMPLYCSSHDLHLFFHILSNLHSNLSFLLRQLFLELTLFRTKYLGFCLCHRQGHFQLLDLLVANCSNTLWLLLLRRRKRSLLGFALSTHIGKSIRLYLWLLLRHGIIRQSSLIVALHHALAFSPPFSWVKIVGRAWKSCWQQQLRLLHNGGCYYYWSSRQCPCWICTFSRHDHCNHASLP